MENRHDQNDNKQTTSQSSSNYTKISTTLLTSLYQQLLPHLRSPLSRTVEGKPDKGAIASWMTEQAHSYLASYDSTRLMRDFLIEQGLVEEFNLYAAKRNPSMFDGLL
jgi:hypothetical protein